MYTLEQPGLKIFEVKDWEDGRDATAQQLAYTAFVLCGREIYPDKNPHEFAYRHMRILASCQATDLYASHLFVATDSNRLLGMSELLCQDKDLALLIHIAVDNAVRNRKVGSLLLSHTEEFARQKQSPVIVLSGDPWVRGFYDKNGYDIVDTESGFSATKTLR